MFNLTPRHQASHAQTVLPATPHEALSEARRCAVGRRVSLTRHARTESLPDRNLSIEDVICALSNGRECCADGAGKWKVFGPDLDDNELSVVIVFEFGVLVVTVFGPRNRPI